MSNWLLSQVFFLFLASGQSFHDSFHEKGVKPNNSTLNACHLKETTINNEADLNLVISFDCCNIFYQHFVHESKKEQ